MVGTVDEKRNIGLESVESKCSRKKLSMKQKRV